MDRTKELIESDTSEKSLIQDQDDGLDATRETWGRRAQEKQDPDRRITAWSDLPVVHREYMNPLISGEGHTNWFEWVARTFFSRPVGRALSIGCGDGALERHGIMLSIADSFDAYDVSPVAIETAGAAAEAQGYSQRISYYAADLNRQEFPPAHYNAVFASQSLHHIHDLEHLFFSG